jgi:hypothetical protein
MNTTIRSLTTLFASGFLLSAANALAAGDVALVNQLAGDVNYSSGAGTAKAKPFMKVRENDRFTLTPGSQLRLVYFQGGRQESYTGPAVVVAGADKSSQQSGAQGQVSTLPSGVSQKIAQTPELVQIAKLGRSGGVAVRGVNREQRLTPQQLAEVRQAREVYQQLRAQASPDDITPELYLYSVLQDHLLYNDMKPIVEEMVKRQPGNTDVSAMQDYVKVKTEAK